MTYEHDFLNGKEAAEFLNISYNTLLALREAGKIRCHKLSSRTILYSKRELIEDIRAT